MADISKRLNAIDPTNSQNKVREHDNLPSVKEMMNEHGAAEYLGIGVSTLQHWRCRLEGPSYVRVGGPNGKAIRYRRSDLDAWIDANTVTMGEAV